MVCVCVCVCVGGGGGGGGGGHIHETNCFFECKPSPFFGGCSLRIGGGGGGGGGILTGDYGTCK